MSKEISTVLALDDVMDFDFFDFSNLDPIDLKKEAIAANLCSLMAFKNISRVELAKKLNWKLSQVSKVLSGKQNLTISTISKVCFALNYDFQISFHEEHEQLNVQPWERNLQSIVSLKENSESIENWHTLYKKQSPVEIVIDILSNNACDHYLSPISVNSYKNNELHEKRASIVNPHLKTLKHDEESNSSSVKLLYKDFCNV
ncbi:hypothetical protein APC57_03975 [Acinetobacter baumannii]|uniref:helix-turn-helix domain-containing protein n=1 Tax=Acinetobacter baumannii TaxID=470 RepID=UPI0007076874|nr:helix-turn-helix transcriptional regulator [Acinetobacter baumannii]KQG97047.1 hypothetical protein APC57_03975 [Acinetobacter baumannii]